MSGGVLESYNTSFRDCWEIKCNLVCFIDSIVQSCPKQKQQQPTTHKSATVKTDLVNKAMTLPEDDLVTRKKENLDSINTVTEVK